MMVFTPIADVPLSCIQKAAHVYQLPAKVIISVLEAEHGKNGEISKNKNGSYDIGPMQINSSMLPELRKYHITQADIQFNACNNVMVGTWILGKKIAHGDNLLEGIGDYNSHTRQFNKNYYTKIRVNYTKINMMMS